MARRLNRVQKVANPDDHKTAQIPLYIGKSIKLRSRVMSHFQAAGREAREMRIAQEIRRVEWIETAGELGALLLEARLVKELQPLHNRQLRRERTLCAWRLDDNPSAKPLVTLVRGDDLQPREFGQMYGVYRSKNQALSGLRELADTHGLCHQALGFGKRQRKMFRPPNRPLQRRVLRWRKARIAPFAPETGTQTAATARLAARWQNRTAGVQRENRSI